MRALFSRYVVSPGSIARQTLYTWTTREQIEALKKDRVLLTRSESPVHGASYFEQQLTARAEQHDALAGLLRTSAFARARFAWPAPWATLLGIGGESYGDELIEVRLKPEAWIVVFQSSSPELRVIDLENRPVATKEALAHPERIAAVYFMHDNPVSGYAASTAGLEERMGYREYVLCNESMIASWGVHTESIARELGASAEAMKALGEYLQEHPWKSRLVTDWNKAVAKGVWQEAKPEETPLALYEASLAFPHQNYLPFPGTHASLAEGLRRIRTEGPGIEHAPTAKFPSASSITPSPPPRVVKPKSPMRGTF